MTEDHKEDEVNNYIHNLDVSNVLTVDLELANENNQYIDSSIYRNSTKPDKEQDKEDSNEDIGHDNYTDNILNVPGVPPVPDGIDPKRMCPFCQKTFSHPGSMGRHLDLKKGTPLHPFELINKIRSSVKRRGNIEASKERKRLRSKRYNSKKEVKERNKIQRRSRDKLTRVKKSLLVQFFNKLGRPVLQPHPTFPRVVLYFLSPNQWPHDPPTLETYRTICGVINQKFPPEEGKDTTVYEELMKKVHTASENWMSLTDLTKQEIWVRELRRAAEDALTNTTLFELNNRDNLILQRAQYIVEQREKGIDVSDVEDDNDEDDEADEQEDHEEGDDHQDVNGDNRDPTTNHNTQVHSDFVYNQEDLAAVAEAAVAEAVVRRKNDPSHNLDPQLIN